MSTTTSRPARASRATKSPTTEDLVAQVTQLATRVDELAQIAAERATAAAKAGAVTADAAAAQGQPPLYATVEAWVRDYLLPTFPRPVGEVGAVRWHWCSQWWRHDEAVTRLTALWYGWEHARLEMTGMLGWLRELDHHLPILCGDDGPFRNCSQDTSDDDARHDLPPIAGTQAAPSEWWDWWS